MMANLSAYLGMGVGILVVQHSGDPGVVSRWILACAAGSFLYIALVDLVPEMSQVHVIRSEDEGDIDPNSWGRFIAQVWGFLKKCNLFLECGDFVGMVNYALDCTLWRKLDYIN